MGECRFQRQDTLHSATEFLDQLAPARQAISGGQARVKISGLVYGAMGGAAAAPGTLAGSMTARTDAAVAGLAEPPAGRYGPAMLRTALATLAVLAAAPAGAAGTACPGDFAGGEPPTLVNPKLARDAYPLCLSGFATLFSGVTRMPVYSADRAERRRRWLTLRMRKALGNIFMGPYA